MAAPFVESIGYDGTISEGQLAVWAPTLGRLPHVARHDSWRLRVIAGASVPTVEISAGSGGGDGIWDTTDAPHRLTLPVPSGTTERWDTIVVARDWRPTPAGDSSFQVRTGTSARATSSAVRAEPGVLADQALFRVLVRGGSTAVQAVDDLRSVASPVHSVLGDVVALRGAEAGALVVSSSGELFRFWPDAGGSLVRDPIVAAGGLLAVHQGAFYDNLAQSGTRKLPGGQPDTAWRVYTGPRQVIGECVIPNPGRPHRLSVDLGGEFGAQDDDGTRWNFFARRANAATGDLVGRLWCTGPGEQTSRWRHMSSNPSPQVFPAASTRLFLVAERQRGAGVGELSAFHQHFNVAVHAA